MKITVNRSTLVTTKVILDISKLKAKDLYETLQENGVDVPQMKTKSDLEKFFKDTNTSAEEVFDAVLNAGCYESKTDDYSDTSEYWLEVK